MGKILVALWNFWKFSLWKGSLLIMEFNCTVRTFQNITRDLWTYLNSTIPNPYLWLRLWRACRSRVAPRAWQGLSRWIHRLFENIKSLNRLFEKTRFPMPSMSAIFDIIDVFDLIDSSPILSL